VSTSAAFDTSVLTKRASPPACLIIRTVSSPPSTRMSATTVFAPSRANASPLALPIPEAAPVTKATLPSNWLVISPLPGSAPLIGPPDVRLWLRFVMNRYNAPLQPRRLAVGCKRLLGVMCSYLGPQALHDSQKLRMRLCIAGD